MLGIAYTETTGGDWGDPESVVLNNLQRTGWVGSNCEGGTIKCLLKAAAFDGLMQQDDIGEESVKSAYLEALMSEQGHDVEHLREEVYLTSLAEIRKRYEEIRSVCIGTKLRENLASGDVAARVFEALGRDVIFALLKKYARHNYAIRAGWPDLTVVQQGHVKLIEVKKTDKLHNSQIRTVPELKEALSASCSIEVCRLVRN